VVLVAVTAEHVPDLRRILATPEVWLRWRDEAASPQWPFDDPSVVRFAVVLEGVVRGMVQYGEEDEPDYRHASIDLFLDPAVHRCGVGRDTVAALARYLVHDRGHHRLVIAPSQPTTNQPSVVMRRWDFARSGSCAATSATPTGSGGTTVCSWISSPRNSTSSADHSPCRGRTVGRRQVR